jgi:hypothetical protein
MDVTASVHCVHLPDQFLLADVITKHRINAANATPIG